MLGLLLEVPQPPHLPRGDRSVQPSVLLEDGLRMSVRDPGYLSRANGAYLLVDHFVRGLRFIKKKETVAPFTGVTRESGHAPPYRGTSLIRNAHPPRNIIGP